MTSSRSTFPTISRTKCAAAHGHRLHLHLHLHLCSLSAFAAFCDPLRPVGQVLAAKLPKGVVSVSLTTRPIGRVDTYGGGDRGYGRDRGRSNGSFSRGGSNGRGSSRGGSYGRGSPNEYSGARRSSGGGLRSGESRSASADRSFLSEHGGRDWAGSEVRSYQESRPRHGSSSNQTTASWQSEWDNMKFSSSR